MALLLVTHDLDLARGHADRIALMAQGRMIESGPLPAALAAPHTAALMARMHHRPVRRAGPVEGPPVLRVTGLRHGYGGR
ncbi:ABC transporter ATP-binding protein, partial [Streptomyces galilaeus]